MWKYQDGQVKGENKDEEQSDTDTLDTLVTLSYTYEESSLTIITTRIAFSSLETAFHQEEY